MGYVYMNNASPVGDQNMVASNPLAVRLRHEHGRDEPALRRDRHKFRYRLSLAFGDGHRSSIRGPEGDVDLVESVSYLHGKHAFKFGFEYIDVILDGDTYSRAQGDVVFPTLETFLDGLADVPARSCWVIPPKRLGVTGSDLRSG